MRQNIIINYFHVFGGRGVDECILWLRRWLGRIDRLNLQASIVDHATQLASKHIHMYIHMCICTCVHVWNFYNGSSVLKNLGVHFIER
jgi:hypothetical protein